MQEHLPQNTPAKIGDLVEFVARLRRIVRGIMEKERPSLIREEIQNQLHGPSPEPSHEEEHFWRQVHPKKLRIGSLGRYLPVPTEHGCDLHPSRFVCVV